jgi:hypothetical protein
MLDEQTADRILSGLVAPADAPPGYAAVTRLVLELRGLAERAPARPPGRPAAQAGAAGSRPAARTYAAAAVAGACLGVAALRLWAARSR